MSKFEYAYAKLTKHAAESLFTLLQEVDSSLIKKNDYHLTLCFDPEGDILRRAKPYPSVYLKLESAVMQEVVEWRTQSGERILVAKLMECGWTQEVNSWYRAQGVVEDLPHVPHVTLIKSFSGDAAQFKHLVGMFLCFEAPTGSWLD